MRVIGYLVRHIHTDLAVKDLLYDRQMHTMYPTFADAVQAAHKWALQELERYPEGTEVKQLHNEHSQRYADAGQVPVYYINTDDSFYVFALFAHQ